MMQEAKTAELLKSLMSRYYRVEHLVNVNIDDFKKNIDNFLQLSDYKMEGYKIPDKQRTQSINFYWGHDHDFGSFRVQGCAGMRHISIIAKFINDGFLPLNLIGKTIFDIGCWTGGTSLLLSAMGANVTAIDEVKKYTDCLKYLSYAFNAKFVVENKSLYECVDIYNIFDYVLFAGVLYHLTDPILGLRIIFNSLKDGGIVLIETAAIDSKEQILEYRGSEKSGWNWFFPSAPAVSQMLADVGFKDINISKIESGRLFATGQKKHHVEMMRCGLSNRAVK